MKYLCAILCVCFFSTNINSQYYIDILTYEDESTFSTHNFVTFSDSNYIYILGESSRNEGGVYWMKYDYAGHFIDLKSRYTLGDENMGRTQILVRKKDNRFYIFSEDVFDHGSALRCGEIDMLTGRVIENRILIGMTLVSIDFDGSNNISALGNNDWYDFSLNKWFHSSFIYTFDTNLVFQNSIKIWEGENAIMNSPSVQSIQFKRDSMYEIVGMNKSFFFNRDTADYGIYRWMYLPNGKLRERKLIPEGYHSRYNGYKSLIKNKYGHRIMGLNKFGYDETSKTWENNFIIAYFSGNFDTLFWSTPLFSTRDDKNGFAKILVVCESYNGDGYVALSEWRDTLTGRKQGQIFKVSENGQYEWSRQLTPNGYVTNKGQSLSFKNISSTPYGYLIIGDYYVKNEGTKSFMMHTDQYGCLVPGCQKTVGSVDIRKDDEWAFEMYPNPVQSQLYILSKINSREKHIINLYNVKGDELLQSEFYPQQNSQIMLLLPANIERGMHVLVIRNEKGKSVWRKSVIVQ